MRQAVGLDVGTKTIGVAVCDALALLAHPITTVERQGVRRDVDAVLQALGGRQAACFVVGLPLELDGREERPARLARQIGEAVGAATGLPVYYQDERFSSVQAERRLIAAKVRRDRRKQVIDQEAAVVILESWLAEGGRAMLQGGAG